MTIVAFPDPSGTLVAARGKIAPSLLGGSLGVFRLSTDPLFTASLTLQNIIAGSRYRVTRTSNGAELATGVAAGSGWVDIELTGLSVYSNPMQVDITVRNASGATKYKVFDTSASMSRTGGAAYILQIED